MRAVEGALCFRARGSGGVMPKFVLGIWHVFWSYGDPEAKKHHIDPYLSIYSVLLIVGWLDCLCRTLP